MAPPLLFDISQIDLKKIVHGPDEIERVNPHRGCMRLLDGVVFDELWGQPTRLIAFKDVRNDEFWCEGHIPGRPIFPGVLMIEAAAQCASFVSLRKLGDQAFMGFAGVDGVKFRGMVKPGDRLYILVEETEFRRRRSVCKTQGYVDGNLVFEAEITGMPM